LQKEKNPVECAIFLFRSLVVMSDVAEVVMSEVFDNPAPPQTPPAGSCASKGEFGKNLCKKV
jgi:hypothetical protein